MPDPVDRAALSAALRDYALREPTQAALADALGRFLDSSTRVFERRSLIGHFTGSAWIVDASGTQALLLLHRKLGRWLQPGGHADGDANLARVAAREAEEETGIAGLRPLPGIYDIDCHGIPARGADPAHLHWDLRHAFVAPPGATPRGNRESLALSWMPIASIAADDQADASLRRMARRWLARAG